MLDWPIYHHSNTMFPCLLKIIKLINLFLITLSPCCWPALSVVVSWGYSYLLCMGFLLQWLLLFWSTGSRSRASVFVMHVLSCFVAYGIFLEQRLNQCPLHWQGILSHWKCESLNCVWLFATPRTVARQALLSRDLGKNTGVSSHSLLQEIFQNQGSNLGLPQYRQILYRLSQQWSPWRFLIFVQIIFSLLRFPCGSAVKNLPALQKM